MNNASLTVSYAATDNTLIAELFRRTYGLVNGVNRDAYRGAAAGRLMLNGVRVNLGRIDFLFSPLPAHFGDFGEMIFSNGEGSVSRVQTYLAHDFAEIDAAANSLGVVEMSDEPHIVAAG